MDSIPFIREVEYVPKSVSSAYVLFYSLRVSRFKAVSQPKCSRHGTSEAAVLKPLAFCTNVFLGLW